MPSQREREIYEGVVVVEGKTNMKGNLFFSSPETVDLNTVNHMS